MLRLVLRSVATTQSSERVLRRVERRMNFLFSQVLSYFFTKTTLSILCCLFQSSAILVVLVYISRLADNVPGFLFGHPFAALGDQFGTSAYVLAAWKASKHLGQGHSCSLGIAKVDHIIAFIAFYLVIH